MSPAELREVRKSLALTQAQMAHVLALSRNAVCYYERGSRTPSDTVAMLYAELKAGWRPQRLRQILSARKRAQKTVDS